MGSNEGALKLRPQLGGNVAIRERAEAGRYPVHGLGRIGEGIDLQPGRGHGGEGLVGQGHPCPATCHRDDVVEGHAAGTDDDVQCAACAAHAATLGVRGACQTRSMRSTPGR